MIATLFIGTGTSMPIYEYQCQDCQNKLEVMQRMSEALLKICPACGKEALRKLVSAVGFQLKGTGWYETDFKTKPKAKRDGDGESAGKSESSTPSAEPSPAASSPDTKVKTPAASADN